MKKTLKFFGYGIIGLLILGLGGFLIWASFPLGPEAGALESMASSQSVDYTEVNNWMVFTPNQSTAQTGLIFYPGGRVDYRSYAPHASDIAQEGFLVVVVPMPLNFAFFGVNRAEDVIEVFPNIETWAVGGHSLGGAMAAQFAQANRSLVEGLVLWAAYPPNSADLTTSGLEVISISASNDGVASREEIEDSRERLPQDATFVEIQGGNHAGFGWYGQQRGDGNLDIPKSVQQEQIVDLTASFLRTLGQ
jgi:pimeloyl-ACP methyl ester carboxylesterase